MSDEVNAQKPPDRPTSAPPILELQRESIFAFTAEYAHIFSSIRGGVDNYYLGEEDGVLRPYDGQGMNEEEVIKRILNERGLMGNPGLQQQLQQVQGQQLLHHLHNHLQNPQLQHPHHAHQQQHPTLTHPQVVIANQGQGHPQNQATAGQLPSSQQNQTQTPNQQPQQPQTQQQVQEPQRQQQQQQQNQQPQQQQQQTQQSQQSQTHAQQNQQMQYSSIMKNMHKMLSRESFEDFSLDEANLLPELNSDSDTFESTDDLVIPSTLSDGYARYFTNTSADPKILWGDEDDKTEFYKSGMSHYQNNQVGPGSNSHGSQMQASLSPIGHKVEANQMGMGDFMAGPMPNSNPNRPPYLYPYQDIHRANHMPPPVVGPGVGFQTHPNMHPGQGHPIREDSRYGFGAMPRTGIPPSYGMPNSSHISHLQMSQMNPMSALQMGMANVNLGSQSIGSLSSTQSGAIQPGQKMPLEMLGPNNSPNLVLNENGYSTNHPSHLNGPMAHPGMPSLTQSIPPPQQVCRYFSQGFCSRGDRCNFAHIPASQTNSSITQSFGGLSSGSLLSSTSSSVSSAPSSISPSYLPQQAQQVQHLSQIGPPQTSTPHTGNSSSLPPSQPQPHHHHHQHPHPHSLQHPHPQSQHSPPQPSPQPSHPSQHHLHHHHHQQMAQMAQAQQSQLQSSEDPSLSAKNRRRSPQGGDMVLPPNPSPPLPSSPPSSSSPASTPPTSKVIRTVNHNGLPPNSFLGGSPSSPSAMPLSINLSGLPNSAHGPNNLSHGANGLSSIPNSLSPPLEHQSQHPLGSPIPLGNQQVVGIGVGNGSGGSNPSSPVLSPGGSPRLNSSADPTNRFSTIDAIIGQIYPLCKDQHGCRFLQKKLEEQSPRIVDIIFNEVSEHMVELMTDPFGNYLCQKLLEHCSDKQRLMIVEKVAGDLVTISQNMHGTRAVQKMIEYLSSSSQVRTWNQVDEIKLIINALRTSVVTLIQDLNGNHVIQRCLNRLTPQDNQFIYDAVASHCVEVATHRHGCCVMQRCIDHASDKQKLQLIKEITAQVMVLVQDPYGNYVVQYVLDLSHESYKDWLNGLVRKMLGNIVELSRQKFSSNVIEKCLHVADQPTRALMIQELMEGDSLLMLLQDPFANYVIQTALNVSEIPQHTRLVECIKPHLASLRNTPYGKRIQNKILKERDITEKTRNKKH